LIVFYYVNLVHEIKSTTFAVSIGAWVVDTITKKW
jgi:hypothetical protein